MKNRINIPLLLIGMFGETHVRIIGSIGISELFIYLVAPFIFITDFEKLKRDGFIPLLVFALMASVGCIISSMANDTHFQLAIRGFASTYALFAIPVVLHHFLSRDLSGLRWLLAGLAISGLITLFAFQGGVEMSVMEKTGGDITKSELFVTRHFGHLFSLPYEGWYLETPFWLTAVLIVVPVVYTVCATSTGRSMLLVSMMSLSILLCARRSRLRMQKLRKHIVSIGICGALCALITASGYKVAAEKGWLNEASQRKYETQTKSGTGPLALLMHGRSEFFVGFMACLDKPLTGYGPWAMDDGYFWGKFLTEYGSPEDAESYAKAQADAARFGRGFVLIPAHSHLIGFWLWYGILGLPFWIYVLKNSLDYFRFAMDAVPQWFGFVALGLPANLWGIFFSPFTGRIGTNIFITCVLLSLAVAKGKLQLPPHMQLEIIRKERR